MFQDTFTMVLWFLVSIVILVTIHEFGHFYIARRCGVKVLRFSIGFGKRLWARTDSKGTEYAISAIPLGGYVKMLDEREGEVPDNQKAFAFNRQSTYSRFAIAAAGPAFNFIFAVVAYAVMYFIGVQGMLPEVGDVEQDSLAYEAGLSEGDVFLQINDKKVYTWEDTSIELIDQGLKTGVVKIRKMDAERDVEDVLLDLSNTKILLGDGSPLEKIGVQPWRLSLEAKLGKFTKDSAAQQQGFMEGDIILSANGNEIKDWSDWVELVRSNPGISMDLLILRNGVEKNMPLVPLEENFDGEKIGKIGAYPWVDEAEIEKRRITVQEDIIPAINKGFSKTLDMSVLTVKLLGKLIPGEASVKNISGPISIAEFAGVSAQLGLATFLSTLAIFSISIGILNLLPVPILDGGHLMYCVIEILKGSPVSESTQLVGQKIGMFMLAGLMTSAFYNDFQRVFS